MKKFYLTTLPIILVALSTASYSFGQCPAGSSTANINWDNLDYLTQSGTYAGFVSLAMLQSQKFTIGTNRVTINFPTGSMTTNGENITNIAEAGSFGTGADIEYNGNGIITITFDTVVHNLQFSLYDIDILQSLRVTAVDAAAVPLNINMTVSSPGIVTIAGNGGSVPTATASNTALANNDTRGTVNVSIAGSNPAFANGVKSVSITMGFAGGTAGNFWLSDIAACVYGSFPNNYYISQQPFIGQPAYYLVTPDNNSVYLFNPLTGKADWLFSEPSAPWVNSMAYDHVNKILYYVMDHPSPLSSNKMLKKYNFNTETISVVVADITTIGIPLFDIVVESAGAAFYNGSLFLGIEGTNGAKNSNRESIIWRIDFDAAQNPVKTSQVFASPADNGSGTLTHDWGDFSIKDGMLYDFNTGNVGSTSRFIHYNMQNGATTTYNTNGNPAPIQAGQIWNGSLYWTGGQSPETGRVALYNENGTIGPKIVATTTVCSPGWVGRAGDASDPFRPKSDFGDAPDSYDPVPMDKATHEFDCNLRLGPTFDREWNKTSSTDATADGSDEDGISYVSILPPGVVNYVQDVKVYNNTGSTATLVGWLDYDADGVFEAGEGRSITVPSNTAIQTVSLSWPGISVLLPIGSTTFLRIRLTSLSNGMGVNNATRWFANGEVEDYRVYVNMILPVELLEFTAKSEQNTKVLLKWKTGRETNFSGFDIERSEDGINWNKIAFVPSNSNGQDNNSYNFYDYDPYSGRSYYRLKLVDFDGNYKYSQILSVELEQTSVRIKITPNPISRYATIQFTNDRSETANLYIVDANGKRVMSRSFDSRNGVNEIYIDDLVRYVPGVYMVHITTPTKSLSSKAVVQPGQ